MWFLYSALEQIDGVENDGALPKILRAKRHPKGPEFGMPSTQLSGWQTLEAPARRKRHDSMMYGMLLHMSRAQKFLENARISFIRVGMDNINCANGAPWG